MLKMKISSVFFATGIGLLLLSTTSLSAQVTFGSQEDPEAGALVEVKTKASVSNPLKLSDLENADKGVLFPKVKLLSYDDLTALSKSPHSQSEMLKATGMAVYNVNDHADGINVGFVEWNGNEWVRPGDKARLADITVVCNSIEVTGYFNKNRWLTPMYNTLIVTVDVTRSGIYEIRMDALEGTSSTDAGFSFTASGEFTGLGTRNITLFGEGKPLKSTAEIGAKNSLRTTLNDRVLASVCADVVQVDGTEANFTFNCSSLRKSGTYTHGVAMTEDNVLLLGIVSGAAGGEFIIETDRINGIKFRATGTLAGTNQTVTLYAEGTPTVAGTYTYTLKNNSSGGVSSPCSVDIDFN